MVRPARVGWLRSFVPKALKRKLKIKVMMNRASLRLPKVLTNARGCCSAGVFLLLCFCLAACGEQEPERPGGTQGFAVDWQARGALAAMRETDEQVKEQVLNRLAFDGSEENTLTNSAPLGKSPSRYQAPELAAELIKRVNEQGDAAIPALRALATLELTDEQLRGIADEVDLARVLSQTSADPKSVLDDRRRGIYLGSLRVLIAHSDRDSLFVDKISEALKQQQAPGLSDAPAPLRPLIESKWKTYQADLAQTLLATHNGTGPPLDRIVSLWEELNSPSHIQQSMPHGRLISPCALGAAAPDKLATIFADHIRQEESASPSVSTFLLVESLMGLACTKTQDPENLKLVVSVFNAHRDANEQITLSGKPYPTNINDKAALAWIGTRSESVRGAAAAALIRLGVAGKPGMPSIRDALRDMDRDIDDSSLPGSQQIKELLPEEFRKELGAAAVELLKEQDEHLRAAAAHVIADLWLAGNEDGAAVTALRESAKDHGDAEVFKSLLLIAHAGNASPTIKSDVKALFKTSLTQDQGVKRRGAVVAIGSLYVKDESPRIRSNLITYIPVPPDKDFAKELAPILAGVYTSLAAEGAKAEQQDVPNKKAEILKALGFLRAEASGQILDIIASEDLQATKLLQKEALNAAARSGPLQLKGICRLLDVSVKDAAIEAPMRAVAYYVSSNDDTTRLLISTLGPTLPGGAADETEERLWAINTTLKECNVSNGLRDVLGNRTIELVKAQRGKKNPPLLHELAEKFKDTPFAGELSKAAGPVERGMSRWYYVLIGVGIVLLSMLVACEIKPRRKLRWYAKVPAIPIPIPTYSLTLPLRPLTRVALRPYSNRALDAWVESYVSKARIRYERSCSKIDMLPYAVKVNATRRSRLEAKHLRSLFSKTQIFTAVTGRHTQRRTELACLLGWWAMAEKPGERLCDHLMLPVIIRASSELLKEEKKERDPFLEEIKRRLWMLIMDEEKIDNELVRQLLKRRRVLIIIDGFEAGDQDLMGRFVAHLDEYPVNARIVTSSKSDLDVFDPPPDDIISTDA